MQKKCFKMAFALLLIISMAVQSAYTAQASDTSDDIFYQELAKLLNEQDFTNYFGKMELQIGNNKLTNDGEIQILDVVPEVVNDRTMLPIRAVAEAAGATVEWIQETATVSIESAYGNEINCSIGSDRITINNTTSDLDASPYIKAGRTYLPLRAVSEALELEVGWNADDSMITLTAPYQTARVLVLDDSPDLKNLEPDTTITDGNGLWVLQFSSPTEAKEAVEILGARGITAEPDRYIPPIKDEVISGQLTQNASSYSWGVTDCGFDSFVSNNSSRFTGTGVVAVIDTGVDAAHPFLSGRLLPGYDVIDGDNSPNDGNGHGTHVSGIILDCVGNAPVSILPIRVLDNKGSGTDSSIIAGIRYAATHNADVINLSLGGIGHYGPMDDAIEFAISKGVAVVISAGNDDSDTSASCPAHTTAPGSIVVSSGDSDHNKAYSSNYGSNIDLMAPGVGIRSSVPNGVYDYKSGTSMAAPHAAAAAILLDLAWGKTLTPAVLEEKVHSATTYGYWNNQYEGYGFLNMRNADLPLTSYQIYFDSNGGSSPVNNKKVVQGQAYGELPEPTRTGYFFDGWYTAKSGGTQIVATTIVTITGDQTLYAHWRDTSTSITFHSLTVPNGLIEGNQAHVDGEIRSANSPITAVKAEVLDAANQSVVLSAAASGFSVSTYGPIKNSKIDTELNFTLLTAGTYYVKYTASAEDGTTSTAETSTFQIVAPPKENISYADCDVEIACINGQIVNLYDNPGDTSRVSYFSKGQIARSIYCATLSDGSTWYRINAFEGETYRTFWLKYEPNKMTIITYADCNVEIACFNGQVVNLYDNPGDTSRASYFSKGQIARSIYCATLSDGSIWYRVNAFEGETYRTFWLKYEPDKMTVAQ